MVRISADECAEYRRIMCCLEYSYLRLSIRGSFAHLSYRYLEEMASRRASTLLGSSLKAGSTGRVAPSFRRGVATTSRSGPGVNRAILALGALALPVRVHLAMKTELISRRTSTTTGYISIQLAIPQRPLQTTSSPVIPINHMPPLGNPIVDQARKVK